MSEPEAGRPPDDAERRPGVSLARPSAYQATIDPLGPLPVQGGYPPSPYAASAFPAASTQPYDVGSIASPPYGEQDWQQAPPVNGGPNGYGGPNGQAVVNGHGVINGTGVINGNAVLNGQTTVDGANGYGAGANGYGTGANGASVTQEPWLGTSVPPRRATLRTRRADAPSDDTAPETRRSSLRKRRKSQTALGSVLSGVVEVVVVLSMALTLSLLIKTFLVQAFFIPSQSMEDSLLIGDRVLVSKLTPGPFQLHRGDVVVFKDTQGWLPRTTPPEVGPVRKAATDALTFVGLLPADSGEHLIKRVIGLPGDTVACCDAQGRLTVNGIPITEPYVRKGNKPSNERFTVTVRAGQLWVMGDNRSESADSRLHRNVNDGQVPIKDVVGKAFAIVWPFGRFGGVPEPPNVFAGVPARAASP